MQSLRPILTVFLLLLIVLLSGCWSVPHKRVTPQTVVGNYVFHADDPGAPHDPDRLTLRADGTYLLAYRPGGRLESREAGQWRLWNEPGDPEVLFGRAGYPIQVKGKRLRLLVSDDLAQWYEKVR